MNRKLIFAAAIVGLGTLAGCSRTENPLAPRTPAQAHASSSTTPGSVTTTSNTTADEAPADSLPGTGTGVVFTTGGN